MSKYKSYEDFEKAVFDLFLDKEQGAGELVYDSDTGCFIEAPSSIYSFDLSTVSLLLRGAFAGPVIADDDDLLTLDISIRKKREFIKAEYAALFVVNKENDKLIDDLVVEAADRLKQEFKN